VIELDIIGQLFDPPTVEGGEPVELPGWHVNATVGGMAERPDLSQFLVTPSRMRRVWAGDDPVTPVLTVALKFADAAEADDALTDPED
jgi:hypothetical protein